MLYVFPKFCTSSHFLNDSHSEHALEPLDFSHIIQTRPPALITSFPPPLPHTNSFYKRITSPMIKGPLLDQILCGPFFPWNLPPQGVKWLDPSNLCCFPSWKRFVRILPMFVTIVCTLTFSRK